jgi:phage terminase small subunit
LGELNIKQKRVADFYIETGNAAASYVPAGYEAKGQASRVSFPLK